MIKFPPIATQPSSPAIRRVGHVSLVIVFCTFVASMAIATWRGNPDTDGPAPVLNPASKQRAIYAPHYQAIAAIALDPFESDPTEDFADPAATPRGRTLVVY